MNPFKKQLGFALPIAILIVVVFVVAGAGYYFYKTSQKSETLPKGQEDYKQVLALNFIYSGNEAHTGYVPGGIPYYFNKDNEDNIYIGYLIEHKEELVGQIRVFDLISGNSRPIFHPEFDFIGDFVVDEKGNIYIASSQSYIEPLVIFSPTGIFQKTISLDDLRDELWKSRKEIGFDKMYIADDKIYAKVLSEKYISSYLIGIIKNGVLEKVEPLLKFRGVLGSTSGNWYEVEIIERHKKATISILDSSGTVLQTINLERERLASIEFLGEDQDGNIYIQIERAKESGVGIELEVHKFDSEGNHLTIIIGIPTTVYTLWSNKLLLLGKDGTIWQVGPADDGWHINKWSISR